MNYYTYVTRLESTLYSRGDLEITDLRVVLAGLSLLFQCTVCFYDGSELVILEQLKRQSAQEYARIKFSFHYQSKTGSLVFRYDNSPHYPHLSTFPAHKHIPGDVIAAIPPDLTDVLREIDAIIYPNKEQA